MSEIPIAGYAMVGDAHGSALVARDGSVDWCCLGRFDADPVFARLLDRARAGALTTALEGPTTTSREYVPGTNVLRTEITGRSGRVALTDFMPVERSPGSRPDDYATLVAPHAFVRVIEALEGRPQVELRLESGATLACATRFRPELVRGGGRIRNAHVATDLSLARDRDALVARFQLAPGERRHVVVSREPLCGDLRATTGRWLDATLAFWREYEALCRYEGPHQRAVRRSALVLKMLTYAPTGAVVAAPTTSLPEDPGGVRNFDYRFCWLRDAAFSIGAFAAVGYLREGVRFGDFLRASVEQTSIRRAQVLYAVDGGRRVRERPARHLAGYADSRPVRIGNDACRQRQAGVFGELADWIHLEAVVAGRFPRSSRRFLRKLARHFARTWVQPGHGLWEMQGEPRRYVIALAMSWVALDRALRLLGRDATLVRERDRIARVLATEAVHEDGFLVKALDLREPDAVTLLAPLVGAPVPLAVVERTVAVVQERLADGELVRRYSVDDGLPGRDRAFVACSFWLVRALLALDRRDEAHELFSRVVARANDVGLLAEEIDPATGAQLGNFPQGFSHFGLVMAAVDIELARRHGPAVLTAPAAERVKLHRAMTHEPARRAA